MSTPRKNKSKKKLLSPPASPKEPTKSSTLAKVADCSASAAQAEIINEEAVDAAVVEAIDNQPCFRAKSSACKDQPFSRAKSSPCKGTGAGTDSGIIAYVHCLSPTRRNKKDTLDYSTLILQTEEKPTQEALLHSKNKRPLLTDSEQSRTPVKIQRYTLTTDGAKVIINDMTRISVPDQSEYSFQFKETAGSSSQPTSVEDILQSCSEWDCVTL